MKVDQEVIVAVFIVSRKTRSKYRRVLWHVTRDEAKKICSDPRTASNNYMLCFTEHDIEDGKFVPDNGMHDQVLKDYNITPIKDYNG